MTQIKLSVIVPTYNEAENLKVLIPELVEKLKPFEIIVVDDNSPDDTVQVMTDLTADYPQAKLLVRRDERGIGSAIAKGYDEAAGDVLLSIDADLSMKIEDTAILLNKLEEGCDVVVGSRYIPGGQNRKEAFLPRMASVIGNIVFDKVFKLPVHDVSMNFRVLKKSVWNQIKTVEQDNVMLLEMLVNAHRKGFKVTEIPTIFGDRIMGESKTNIRKLIPRYIEFIWKRRKN